MPQHKSSPFEGIIFPQYRKYKNNKSFFKIISADEFEEKYFIGSRLMMRHFKAQIFPDRNFIMDLLINYRDFADEIHAREYEMQKVDN